MLPANLVLLLALTACALLNFLLYDSTSQALSLAVSMESFLPLSLVFLLFFVLCDTRDLDEECSGLFFSFTSFFPKVDFLGAIFS
tara:strand:- start:279 stop:533 length:255 start_codon:yes stop_codon:yes gene_type:complete